MAQPSAACVRRSGEAAYAIRSIPVSKGNGNCNQNTRQISTSPEGVQHQVGLAITQPAHFRSRFRITNKSAWTSGYQHGVQPVCASRPVKRVLVSFAVAPNHVASGKVASTARYRANERW